MTSTWDSVMGTQIHTGTLDYHGRFRHPSLLRGFSTSIKVAGLGAAASGFSAGLVGQRFADHTLGQWNDEVVFVGSGLVRTSSRGGPDSWLCWYVLFSRPC